MDYRDSHLAPRKGETYHAEFFKNPYRNMVWRFEQGILDRILTTFLGDVEIRHLDFACGTGRILSYLEGRVQSAVGIDVSPSMLRVARENNKTAEIIEADITRNDVLGDRKFNLITAFRFFPNAQPELRRQVMAVLARRLDETGCLVFNNHKNTGSARNRLARLLGRRGYQGMSMAEVRTLVAEQQMEIAEIYHLCVFPASEKHMLLPASWLRTIERILARIPFFRALGENLVFVCKRV